MTAWHGRGRLWRVLAAALLGWCAGAVWAATEAPDPYAFCTGQTYLSREVDCRCFADRMTAARAAEPTRAPEVHQQAAAAACPNEAGLREQETQKCLTSPNLYLPQGRDVDPAAYCTCWGREFARERVAFAPRIPLADSSSLWFARAKNRCDTAPLPPAAAAQGADFTGVWQLSVLGYEVRFEMPASQRFMQREADGSRTAVYSGTGKRSGGKPLLGTVDVRVWTDPSGQALNLRAGALGTPGCEGRRRAEGVYEGRCVDAVGALTVPFTWARATAGAPTAAPPPTEPTPALVLPVVSIIPTAAEREPATDSARMALAEARTLTGATAVYQRAKRHERVRRDPDAARVVMVYLIDTYPGSPEAALAAEWLQAQRREASQAQACVGGPSVCATRCTLKLRGGGDNIAALNACMAECRERCR